MPTYPHFQYESALWAHGSTTIIGLDEVGRGALAGPVVVGAVAFTPNVQKHPDFDKIATVRDSKTLSRRQLANFDIAIRQLATFVGIGTASSAEIDTLGIKPATHLAAVRALQNTPPTDDMRLITDFGLFDRKQPISFPYDEYINGDANSFTISAASIIAKVWRDNYMHNLSQEQEIDDYDWTHNVGYGTHTHCDALKKYGPSPHHRLTFIKRLL